MAVILKDQLQEHFAKPHPLGDLWIAITRNDDWNLKRAEFADGKLHLTSIAHDHNDEEVPVIGTLVLSKSQQADIQGCMTARQEPANASVLDQARQ